MVKVWHPAVLALGVAAFTFSCGNKMRTREAVERGVRKGVSERGVNVDAMDVSVTSVNFRDDRADAVVAFIPKGGKISDGLTMHYSLELRKDEWVIVGRSQMDMKQHAGDALPPGHPDAGAANQPGNPLPPGHPPLDGTKP